MTEKTKLQKVEQQLVEDKNISDTVMNKLHVMQAQGNLDLPENYSAENAIKQAWLKILETQDKDKKRALDVVTKESVAYALQDMVTLGLNPGKNQCYFIVHGQKLTMMPSYLGNMMITKRVTGAKEVNAQVIFEGDDVEYETENGKIVNLKHKTKFGNRDSKQIIGAYATVVFDDESMNYTDIMTWEEIEQAWKQSPTVYQGNIKDHSTHRKFPVEMAKKTVINRTTKKLRNSSDDESILSKQVQEYDKRQRKEVFDAEVEGNQATEELDIPREPDVPDFEEAKYTEPEKEPAPAYDPETGEVQQASFDDEDTPF
ncbi:recombinase RecT [Salinicoccus sesuvii]|uniref:Recombinase RecT n=1 Tax=Salinicoccus sesuvii TaxID=868281 RepID=A0ABV7N6C6_9STAP